MSVWCDVLPSAVCSSKDGLVKLWDLDTQHCFQTLVSRQKEVLSVAMLGGSGRPERLVVATGDSELTFYQFSHQETSDFKVCYSTHIFNSTALHYWQNLHTAGCAHFHTAQQVYSDVLTNVGSLDSNGERNPEAVL